MTSYLSHVTLWISKTTYGHKKLNILFWKSHVYVIKMVNNFRTFFIFFQHLNGNFSLYFNLRMYETQIQNTCDNSKSLCALFAPLDFYCKHVACSTCSTYMVGVSSLLFSVFYLTFNRKTCFNLQNISDWPNSDSYWRKYGERVLLKMDVSL